MAQVIKGLYASTNTLKERLAKYCATEWFVAKEQFLLDAKIEETATLVNSMHNTEGTVVSFTKEQIEGAEQALEELQEQRKRVRKMDGAKFSFTHEADKALRKEWREAPSVSYKGEAIQHFLQAFGVTANNNECIIIARKMGAEDVKATKLEKVALDNAGYTEDKTTINVKLLYKYLIDCHIETGCFSPKLIPEDLKEAWQARRDKVQAEKAAKKAKREAAKNTK